MVNYKSNYLKMKLKYINAKYKQQGGMDRPIVDLEPRRIMTRRQIVDMEAQAAKRPPVRTRNQSRKTQEMTIRLREARALKDPTNKLILMTAIITTLVANIHDGNFMFNDVDELLENENEKNAFAIQYLKENPKAEKNAITRRVTEIDKAHTNKTQNKKRSKVKKSSPGHRGGHLSFHRDEMI